MNSSVEATALKQSQSYLRQALFFIFLNVCLFNATAQENIRKTDSIMSAILTADKPGALVMVIKNDRIVFNKGYGLSNVSTHTNINSTTSFYIASLSKAFTAMAIQILAEKKKVNYSDKVKKYIKGLPGYIGSVTVLQLLTHSSGIPDFYNLTSDYSGMTNNTAIALLKKTDTAASPLDSFMYSNSNYILLSEIVKVASGTSYANFLKKEIFKPLGMLHTYVKYNDKIKISNRATGYSVIKDTVTISDYDGFATGPGGIYSTGADMMKWLCAIKDKKLLSAASYEMTLTPYKNMNGANGTPKNTSYGLGWMITQTSKFKLTWHLGGMRGFRTGLIIIPAENIGVLILSNIQQFNTTRYLNQIGALFMN